jgi:hypothetical protein
VLSGPFAGVLSSLRARILWEGKARKGSAPAV